MLYAIILAGGKGERFWPLSRQLEPKQFLKLTHDNSLIQNTVSRIKKIVPSERIYIITNLMYVFELEKQLSKFNIPKENIFLEPEGKNTTAAIGWAAVHLRKIDPESIMMVLPSDHLILKDKKFIDAIKQAVKLVKEEYLVTLGAITKYPSTGYGYIKIKKKINNTKSSFYVEKFIEKPNKNKALSFFKDRSYYWNSGIFVWKGSVILEEMNRYQPLLYKQLSRISNSNFKRTWKRLPSISVDYGILEKSKRVVMVATDMNWADLGNWKALDDVLKKDKNGNIFNADFLDIDSKNITVWAKNKLVATIGLKDIIIADTPDALLVCRKDESEKVKQIVGKLKKKKRQEYILQKTVKRPWGSYTVLDTSKGFSAKGKPPAFGWKIKLVEVEPMQRLSLQFHRRRAEHWVIVEGRAKIQYGKSTKYIYPNQSIYIPAGRAHRIENPLNRPLKIVEVQTGDYLEEDDIVRLKDDYKRY
ncbi:MAG: mannose-1-phosphate guanylyltransferase/mannose-6-phosphate isomerase [Candidatus Omnitrophica bacterium]|nr:mannose-1-phosphate guanylyltransferase/mannose-6-phosphate isomerase [Candidatus Omnitrophota bacterium]